MENRDPSLFGSQRALGLAWSIPILLAVYVGLGVWLGGLLGSKLVGALAGWAIGMGAVIYEIRKIQRNSGVDSGSKGGAA